MFVLFKKSFLQISIELKILTTKIAKAAQLSTVCKTQKSLNRFCIYETQWLKVN